MRNIGAMCNSNTGVRMVGGSGRRSARELGVGGAEAELLGGDAEFRPRRYGRARDQQSDHGVGLDVGPSDRNVDVGRRRMVPLTGGGLRALPERLVADVVR